MQNTTPWNHILEKKNRFTFVEDTISNLQVTRIKFLEQDRHFCFISKSNFGRFNKPFPTITSMPYVGLRWRRFVLLVQTNKLSSMSYDSSKSRWEEWRQILFDLIFWIGEIYINSNLTIWEAPISSHKTSLNHKKPQLLYNQSHAIKRSIPLEFKGKSMEFETNTESDFLIRRVIAKRTIWFRGQKQIQENMTVSVLVWDLSSENS